MKKLVCLVLSVLLIMSFAPVFAAESNGLQNAILTVKSRIEIPDELSEFSSNVYVSDNGVASYNLQWQTPSNVENRRSLFVEIDQNGYITRYRNQNDEISYYDYEVEARLPKYSEEQLKQKAEEFFKKINPDLSSEFEADTKQHPVNIRTNVIEVRFYRYVNGLKFCGDNALFDISAETGEISDAVINITYCNSIPKPDNVIAKEQAQAKFNEISPMTAEYVTQDKAVLVYRPENKNLMINAENGEKFEPDTSSRKSNTSDAAAASGGGSLPNAYNAESAALSAAEIENVNQISGLLSIEQLRGIAEGIPELGLYNSQYEACYYNKRSEDDYSGSYDYSALLNYRTYDDGKAVYGASVVLNAQNGELLSFYGQNFIYKETIVPKITEAQALSVAKSFAENYANNEYINSDFDIKASDTIDTEKNYYYDYHFSFYRKVNGFNYPENSIWMIIDSQTGGIVSFGKYWNNYVEFESVDNIISADDAFSSLMSQLGLELVYEKNPTDGVNYDAVLVYKLKTDKPSNILASSGSIVNYNGSEYKEDNENTVAADISGHYAESQIQTLINYNVINLPDGETDFRPDDVITQGELIALVAALKGRSFTMPLDYDAVFSYARQCGLLKTDEDADSSAPCKREDGPKYIIRAINYENIAKMSDIFNLGFADSNMISDGMLGYIALAKGFGIIGGNPDNTFAPQEPLTRADAAIMLYNYLSR